MKEAGTDECSQYCLYNSMPVCTYLSAVFAVFAFFVNTVFSESFANVYCVLSFQRQLEIKWN